MPLKFPKPTRQLMTRVEFERWMNLNEVQVLHDRAHLEPCRCRDVNCRGWRFVACTAEVMVPERQRA